MENNDLNLNMQINQSYDPYMYNYQHFNEIMFQTLSLIISYQKKLTQKSDKIVELEKLIVELTRKNEEKEEKESKNQEQSQIIEKKSQHDVELSVQKKTSNTIQDLEHVCMFESCQKSYNSAVSLNLHMKLKHNAGSKKQREAYAKIIFDAEQKGLPLPEIAIKFPPGFLDKFRSSYRYNKHYSM